MLQNRVDPRGDIIKTAARGAWMGNRGVIHDEHRNIIRPYKLKAWLICQLEFKGRQREVMTPDRYTELFFLDEATAFSAGHRPCAECRRQSFDRFKKAWITGNPEYEFNIRTPIWKIDEVLHKERINRGGVKLTHPEEVAGLPNGTLIAWDGRPWLYADRLIFPWTPFGYEDGIALPQLRMAEVLTPRSVVAAFRVGYKPQMALTAFAPAATTTNMPAATTSGRR